MHESTKNKSYSVVAPALTVLLFLCIFISSSFVTSLNVRAASNDTLNFQGKVVVKNGGYNVHDTSPACVLSGQDSCAFRVGYYDATTGGTLLWQEDFLNREIGNYDGVFNLPLGTGTKSAGSETVYQTVFTARASVYMQISFDPSGLGTFVSPEIFTTDGTNRLLMHAVPYAFHANTADQLVASNNQFIKNQGSQQVGASFNVDGSGTIGGALNVNNSQLFVDNVSGNVGIGATSPGQKLTVNGTLGILEGGSAPTYHTIFQGGDQSADITYTLPTSSSTGILKNTSGTLSWNSYGDVSTTTTGVSIVGGTAAVLGSGTTINIATASSSLTGLLTSTDWSTFNNKVATVAGSAGDLQYNGGSNSLAANGNLHWDTVSSRLGVGTAAPNYTLDVNGKIAVAGSSVINKAGGIITIGDVDASGTTQVNLVSNSGVGISIIGTTLDLHNNPTTNIRIENANGSITTPTCNASTMGREYYDTNDKNAYLCKETSPGVYGWFNFTQTLTVTSQKVVTVGTGADYGSIAAAAGYLNSLTGGIMLLTPETHNVNSTINLSNITLIGANTKDTVINITGAGRIDVKETQFKSMTINVDSGITSAFALNALYSATTTSSIIFEWDDFQVGGTKYLIGSTSGTPPTIRTRFISPSATVTTAKIIPSIATSNVNAASLHFVESQGGNGALDFADWNVTIAGSSNVLSTGTTTTIPNFTAYVYPGMNIQSVINSMPSGGVINLLPGVHNISAPLMVTNSSLEISGYGDATIIRAAGFASVNNPNAAIQLGATNGTAPVTDVNLNNFRLEINGQNIHGVRAAGGSDIKLDGLTIIKTSGTAGTAATATQGIEFTDGASTNLIRPVIQNCRVFGNGGANYFTDGIHLTADVGTPGNFGYGHRIVDALVQGNNVDYVRETVAVFTDIDNSSLFNNRFTRMGAGGGGAYGLYVGNATKVNMNANVASGSLSAASIAFGIESFNLGSNKTTQDSIFIANIIDGMGNGGVGFGTGFQVGNAANTTVNRNLFENNSILGSSNSTSVAFVLTGTGTQNDFSNNMISGGTFPWTTGINIASAAMQRTTIKGTSYSNVTTALTDGGTYTALSMYLHTAAANPTAADDNTRGYTVGTHWINSTSKDTFVSVTDATGAAVWKRMDAYNAAAANPGVGNDQTQGYTVGNLWVNTTTQTTYIATSVATGAAVWKQIDNTAGGSGTVTQVNTGNGLTGGPITTTGTVSLGNLTADWQQSGAFNIVLNNASSKLKMMAANGINFGTLGVSALTADRIYNLPDNGGTIALTSDLHAAATIGTANGLSLAGQQISLGLASTGATGALSNTDWNTFNNKQNALTLGNLTGTNVTVTGGTGAVIGSGAVVSIPQSVATSATPTFASMNLTNTSNQLVLGTTITGTLTWTPTTTSKVITLPDATGTVALTSDLHAAATIGTANGLSLAGQQISLGLASTSNTGALSNTDWNTFNNKQSALTLGNLSTTTTGVSLTGATGAVVGTGTTINIQNATNAQPGLLTAADWTTFNAKQAALTLGNITGTNVTVTGGTGAIIGSGVAVSIPQSVATSATPTFASMNLTNTSNQIVLGTTTTGTLTWTPTTSSKTITIPDASGTMAVSATGPLSVSAAGNISMTQANGSTNGYLASGDWTTFNNKQATLTLGDITTTTTGLSLTGATGAVVGAGATINIQTATTLQSGLLSAADWTTFNGKAGPVAGLTGDLQFNGGSNTLAANNTLHWDNTAGNLSIGTNTTNDRLGVTQTVSTTNYNGLGINYTQATNAANITGAALSITATGSGDAADTLYGVNINNITAGNSTEYAINIGSGWDRGLNFNDATPTWGFVNGAQLSWTDGTNNLLLAKDMSTNFGMSMETGAFINRNSYWNEEFSKFFITKTGTETAQNTGTAANLGLGWGDNQGLALNENANCNWSTPTGAAGINGIGRVSNLGATVSCLAYSGTNTAGTPLTPFNVANLPVFIAKVRPSNFALNTANNKIWIGLGILGAAQATDPTTGVYFTNDPATGNWMGVTGNGGALTTVPCGVAVSLTQFGLVKAEVVSATSVNFFVDADVSNGIQWTSCGNSAANIPAANLATMMMNYSTTANRYLDIDFMRVWQDDTVAVAQSPAAVSSDVIMTPVQMESKVEANGDLVIAADDGSKQLMTFKLDGGIETSAGVSASCVGLSQNGSNCNGSIASKYGATDNVEAGDLVSLSGTSTVSKATTEYDDKMVGIVVAAPGITLGENKVDINTLENDAKHPAVAFGGVVEIKVTGNIKKGDYLTSSATPGVAMKAIRPGYAVAQALEDSSKTLGVIKAVVKVGFVDPANVLSDLSGKLNDLQSKIDGINSNLVSSSALQTTQDAVADLQTKWGVALGSNANAKELSQFLGLISIENNAGALNLNILKDIKLNGALEVTGDSNFWGNVTFNNSVIFSQNSGGRALIKSGEIKIDIVFTQDLAYEPIVNLTPRGSVKTGYYVTNETVKGFSIVLAGAQAQDVEFNWNAIVIKPTITPTP